MGLLPYGLGFLIDFLSHAAVVGFMGGAAITIALQQLKGFLGIKKFTKETDIISVMKSVWYSAHHGVSYLVLQGISLRDFKICINDTIAPFFIQKKLSVELTDDSHWSDLFNFPFVRKVRWKEEQKALLDTCNCSSDLCYSIYLIVYITHAEKQGVAIVRHIEKGINPPSVSEIYFTGDYLLKGLKIGIVAGMIALTEAVAIGRTFASMKDLDGNKEMVALGAMNVVGSMTSCYVTRGSFSRSAVNYMAGYQTAVSNIVMSVVIFLTLLFLTIFLSTLQMQFFLSSLSLPSLD